MDFDVTEQQERYSESHELKHSMDDSSAGKLFVGGIAWETTEESFRKHFSQFGEITDAVIMMDKVSGRPRGFGFVTYADAEVANKVLEEDHVIDGRAVEVKKTVPKENMQVKGASKTKKIFIGGLPLPLTEDELKEYFSSYGYVVEHQIMLDQNTGRSRGFGFVTFDNEEAVEKVLSNGHMHELRGKQVEIKRAEPKRGGVEHASESRLHRGGSGSKSYGGFGGSVEGVGGGYGGKMGRGYGGYGGYSGYDGYGKFAGSYSAGAAGFYPGYGGYGYGFGFGGAMYGAAGYGGSSYGAPGYYGGGAGYASSKGYGSSGGGWNDGGKGAPEGGNPAGYGGAKGYGSGSSSGGGNGGARNNGAANGRFHPY
ncbi:PREDICTED: heterogeneous nuclear ribonucleoprotein 1-like [Nicotiana attenuata]|uniref:Heterogeneous nuclear ribonucleoprotein 1 n=1 Tax=Nicotiana attenuata TaxID=49451 RepID=A0A1J6IQC6_NICAT|nr:PREDICTED: heterogeneous nuclear ribonucleoprotein 1-like [Nicotiana attenuata]OIT06460.1 heterogeneous nuclear ribonucleoprotein 1 [Nicotiana attenuata]